VRELNDGVQRFPDLLVARTLGFRQAEFFRAGEEAAAAPSIGISHALFDSLSEQAVVAQARFWARIGRSRVGFRHRGGSTPRRPWSFRTDSWQRAKRCPAGSWPLRVVFLIFPSASWPAGCHAASAGGARGAGR